MGERSDAAGIVIEDGRIAVVILAAGPGVMPDVTVRYLTHEEVAGLRHRTGAADVREFRGEGADAGRAERVRDSLIG